jgi:hypothetical protein
LTKALRFVAALTRAIANRKMTKAAQAMKVAFIESITREPKLYFGSVPDSIAE